MSNILDSFRKALEQTSKPAPSPLQNPFAPIRDDGETWAWDDTAQNWVMQQAPVVEPPKPYDAIYNDLQATPQPQPVDPIEQRWQAFDQGGPAAIGETVQYPSFLDTVGTALERTGALEPIDPIVDIAGRIRNVMERSDQLRGSGGPISGFGGTPGITEAGQALIPTTPLEVAAEATPLGLLGDVNDLRRLGGNVIRAGMPEPNLGGANYGAGIPPMGDDLEEQVRRLTDEELAARLREIEPQFRTAEANEQAVLNNVNLATDEGWAASEEAWQRVKPLQEESQALFDELTRRAPPTSQRAERDAFFARYGPQPPAPAAPTPLREGAVPAPGQAPAGAGGEAERVAAVHVPGGYWQQPATSVAELRARALERRGLGDYATADRLDSQANRIEASMGSMQQVEESPSLGGLQEPSVIAPSSGAPPAAPPASQAPATPSAAQGGGPPQPPPAAPPPGPRPDPARALDGVIPGETVPDAAFRQYEGAVNNAATVERVNLDSGAKKLSFFGVKPGQDTPEMRTLYSALHGEGAAPPKLQAVADDVKRLLAEEEALTVDFDPKFQLHPDYFPRFWKQPPTSQVQPKALGAKPAFTKPRADATFSELLAAGYEPRTWNPYEMVALRRMAGAEYREQSKLLEILKNQGQVLDVSGPIPNGWRIPDVGGAVFQPKPYLDAAGEIRYTPPKMVPNNVANVLEQMFGRQLNWGTVGNVDVHNVVSATFNAPKRVKLLASLFQQSDFARRNGFAAFGAAINDLVSGKPLSAVMDVVRLPKSLVELGVANLSPSWRANLRRQLVSNTPVVKERPGLTWNLISKQGLSTGDVSAFNQTMRDSLVQTIKDSSIKGRPRRIANAINGAMERGLFEGVYPQSQKTAIENFIAPATIRAHPNWTDAQLAASIAVDVNKMFSSLPRSQSALRHVNRNITELARFAIFSTNETESFIKATASMARGPNKAMWVQYWAGGLLFLASVAETVHLAVTGEHLPVERMTPVKTGGPLGVQYNSRFFAPDVAVGAGRGGTNLSLDLLAQMDTAFRMLDPLSFATARENVLVRAASNQIKGSDFYDRPLDSNKKRIGQAVSDVAAPIGVQNLSGVLLKRFPALEGWVAEQEARLGTTGQLAQVAGENLRAETNQQVRDRMAKESGLTDKSGKPLTSWNQATSLQQQEILADPKNKGLAAELEKRQGELAETGDISAKNALINKQEREEKSQQAISVDQGLAAGELTGYEARKLYDDAVKELAIARQAREKLLPERKGQDANTEADKAERAYFAIFDQPGIENEDGTLNFRAYDKALSQWEKEFPGYSKSDVSPARPLSPGHAELIEGRVEARPYFEMQDKAFEKARREQPELFGQFETIEDFTEAEKKIWIKQGMTPEQADRIAQTMVDATLVDAKIDGIFYLFENPEQAKFLVKYGYYVPAAIKKVVELENVAQPAGVR